MEKGHPVRRTVQEFSEWSSVHGIGYIFAASLPVADRLLWALLVLISLGLASYWSVASFNSWQEELTITTLKDAAMPVNRIPFPAVTICSSGLNMEAVKKALMLDFDAWMTTEGRSSLNKDEDRENWNDFMEEKFAIKDRSKNIFDLLRAFQSPNPEQTMKSLFQMGSILACAQGRDPTLQRRKRSALETQPLSLPYWDEDGNMFTRMAVPDGNLMGRDIVKDTCIEAGLLPLCRYRNTQQRCKTGNLAGRNNDLPVRLAEIFCDTENPENCPQLQDLFFYIYNFLQFKNPDAGGDAGTSFADAMYSTKGIVGEEKNAIGIYFTSTTSQPYYAACIQESGSTSKWSILTLI